MAGEEILRSFSGSYYVVAADWGLKPLTRGLLAGRMGVKGLEAVGGSLHLTQWRLMFTCQGINRFSGSFSIPLADVVEARDVSAGIKRAVQIRTAERAHDFNLWGIATFLTALEAARVALDADARERYRRRLDEHGPLEDTFTVRRR